MVLVTGNLLLERHGLPPRSFGVYACDVADDEEEQHKLKLDNNSITLSHYAGYSALTGKTPLDLTKMFNFCHYFFCIKKSGCVISYFNFIRIECDDKVYYRICEELLLAIIKTKMLILVWEPDFEPLFYVYHYISGGSTMDEIIGIEDPTRD